MSLQERTRLNGVDRGRRTIRCCTEIQQILLQHLYQETSLLPVLDPLSQGQENKFTGGYVYCISGAPESGDGNLLITKTKKSIS